MKITKFAVTPVSMITNTVPELQRAVIETESDFSGHLTLSVMQNGTAVVENADLAVQAGKTTVSVLVPPPEKDTERKVRICAPDGTSAAEWSGMWKAPRRWTIYVMKSSHTDIGLHNSQYFQRWQSENFVDEAMKMADAACEQHLPYNYVMEGTWFWNNYGMDRGRAAAEKVRDEYIKTGKLSVCCGIAGNHTQTYGLEEMCRSAYNRNELKKQWDIDCHTMSMTDNNGMSWALVAPYAEAGYRNIIFAPNQWNPLPSTVWKRDVSVPNYIWNPEAGGGGARIDVRYRSELPMVFYWQGPDEQSRLLVWASTMYDWGAVPFGLYAARSAGKDTLLEMEARTEETLPLLEERYPYDLWLTACYGDDEAPNLRVSSAIADWNKTWKWPRFQTLGNPDEPFELLRQKFEKQIPVLHGDITGGWYQHPVAAPDYLADKFAADRALPTAEKLSVAASLADPEYEYPAEAFHRAWYALMMNDEHSYGTSGYQGRRVYETWLQHRDWIDFARHTAQKEILRAFSVLGAKIRMKEDSLLIFNPSAFPRKEILPAPGGGFFRTPEIPSFGYKAVPLSQISGETPEERFVPEPPVVENKFYRIEFAGDGSFNSIFDKELNKELLDPSAPFRGNQFVYTSDNHKTFVTQQKAAFSCSRTALQTIVRIRTAEPVSGAGIESVITLPADEKRIEIDNRLDHVRDLVNKDRYSRYGYYAFPFRVENAVRKAHLNGCVASPGKSGQTGHGTETYLAAREWSCVENGTFGAALFQLDSQLVEFDHIHPDKTDCFMNETGSAVYAYLFNDWLQMHTPGGSHVNLRFRFAITSYDGDFRKAGITQMAERMADPLRIEEFSAHDGSRPAEQSFLSLPDNLRLLAVKRSEEGTGIVVRVQECHGVSGEAAYPDFSGKQAKRITVDEQEWKEGNIIRAFGTATFLFSGYSIRETELADPVPGSTPAAIGGWYTGLITEPRACHGELDGQLYLIWGQNQEKDLSHYELFRSRMCGFGPDEWLMIARVEPGPYRVALYEDTGLETHTRYYYRVRAVNKDGVHGPMSREFSGITCEKR